MAKKKKKKQISNQVKKQNNAEKDRLSSDSAIGWVCLLVAALVLVIVFFTSPIGASLIKNKTAANEEQTQSTEQMPADAKAFEELTGEEEEQSRIYADITVKDYGTITVQLDSEAAPLTVANFVDLANSGFYDGLTFHRIMDGFMMQGGDPTGSGTGDSGTTIKGEFSANGWDNPLSHTRGAISMARADDYDSASCQFFIVQSDSTFLDGNYACFGYVTQGMEYVDAICADAVPTDDNGTILDFEQPVISSVVIRTA